MSLRDYLFHEEPGITLYCGDCREVLPLLGELDAVVTDPPWGIGFAEYLSHDDDEPTYAEFIWPVIQEAERHLTDGYVCVMQSAKRARDWWALFPRPWRLVALPENFVQMNTDKRLVYATNYALLWRVGDPPPKDIPPRDWFVCNTANMGTKNRDGHPCPRPLDGMEHLVRCASEPLWTVLDPFSGSGTTLEACKELGRRAIGIEIEPKYCEIAVKRLRQEVLAL